MPGVDRYYGLKHGLYEAMFSTYFFFVSKKNQHYKTEHFLNFIFNQDTKLQQGPAMQVYLEKIKIRLSFCT